MRARRLMARTRRSDPTGASAHGERGMTTTELAILFPVLLIGLLLTAQATLWGHSRALARSAADYAADVGASVQSAGMEEAAAAGAAQAFLAAAGDLSAARVEVTVTSETVTVIVRGQSADLIGAWGVTAEATVPLERYPVR